MHQCSSLILQKGNIILTMAGRVKSMCAVAKCCATNLQKDRSLFMFPADETRCFQWAQACGIEREYNFLRKHKTQMRNTCKRICGIHFEEKYFRSTKKKRLTDDAVPTLHLTARRPSASNSLHSLDMQMFVDALVLYEHSYSLRSRYDQLDALAVPGPSSVVPGPNGATLCVAQTQTTAELTEVVNNNLNENVASEALKEQPYTQQQQMDQVCQTPITMLLRATEVEAIRSELKAARLKLRSQARRLKRLDKRNAEMKLELQSRPRFVDEWLAHLSAEQKTNILRQVEAAKFGRKGLR